MLDEFIDWYYFHRGSFNPFQFYYAGEVENNFLNMFKEREDRREGELIRGSNIGDPLAVLLLKKLGYVAPSVPLTVLDRNFLYTGFEVEARMISMLLAYDATVSDMQAEVSYRGYKGHIDLILTNDTVIDVKAVKGANFNRMTAARKPYISDRYKTQIAFYKAALGLDKGGLLVYSRDTSDLAYIDLSNDDESRQALDYKIDVLETDMTLGGIWDNQDELIPEVKEEVYKGVATGNYLLPDSMKFTGYNRAFYDISDVQLNGYGREQIYVTGYKTLEEAQKELETWQRL